MEEIEMVGFASLARHDWSILIDEYDLNSPMIGYRDPDRRSAYVAPLATVPVGFTRFVEEVPA
jgi:hypothetical protein